MPFDVDFIPTVGRAGVISGPAGNGRVVAVLPDDLAEIPVATGDGDVGETYNLTGPEACTFTEAASMMSRIAGKSIRFRNGPGGQYDSPWLTFTKTRPASWPTTCTRTTSTAIVTRVTP
jgi:uncharacterized protein YbjT (DUF2867 family)